MTLLSHPYSYATPCKLYPKIFGGAQNGTDTQAMDANLDKDIIVATGRTYDSGLAGVALNGSSVPFLIAYSISTTRIYWAKGDLLMKNLFPSSINLSPNAAYVVILMPS